MLRGSLGSSVEVFGESTGTLPEAHTSLRWRQMETMLFNACNALRMPVDQDCYKELGNGSNSTGAAAVEVRNVSVEGTTEEDHCDGNFGEQVCAMRVQ